MQQHEWRRLANCSHTHVCVLTWDFWGLKEIIHFFERNHSFTALQVSHAWQSTLRPFPRFLRSCTIWESGPSGHIWTYLDISRVFWKFSDVHGYLSVRMIFPVNDIHNKYPLSAMDINKFWFSNRWIPFLSTFQKVIVALDIQTESFGYIIWNPNGAPALQS